MEHALFLKYWRKNNTSSPPFCFKFRSIIMSQQGRLYKTYCQLSCLVLLGRFFYTNRVELIVHVDKKVGSCQLSQSVFRSWLSEHSHQLFFSICLRRPRTVWSVFDVQSIWFKNFNVWHLLKDNFTILNFYDVTL